jgi:hypothetical protein
MYNLDLGGIPSEDLYSNRLEALPHIHSGGDDEVHSMVSDNLAAGGCSGNSELPQPIQH